MKIIFECHRPAFVILADSHQWILARHKITRPGGRVDYKEKTYHPTLVQLYEELFNTILRDHAKKMDDPKGLLELTEKVYKDISSSMSAFKESVRKGKVYLLQ